MKKVFKAIDILSQKKYNKFVIMAFIFNVILIENDAFGKMHIESIIPGFKMIDMNFYNSVADMQNYFLNIGEYGRGMYLMLLRFDVVLCITFFLLQATLLTRLLIAVRKKDQYQWIIVIPLLRSLADMFETVSFMITTSSYPDMNLWLLRVAQFSTPIKWTLLWSTILIMFFLLGIYLFNGVKRMIRNISKSNIVGMIKEGSVKFSMKT